MEPTNLEIARELMDTVRMLQMRIISRHGGRGVCGMSGGVMDLTIPQMNTLVTIRDRGQVTIKELSEALRVSAPSASAMVDRLVEMGAVTREQNPADRREVVVRITPLGEQTVGAMECEIYESMAELLEKIGPEYSQQWREVYRKVREVVGEELEAAARRQPIEAV